MPNVENDDSLRRDLERAFLKKLGDTGRRADRNSDTRLAKELDLVGDLEVLCEELLSAKTKGSTQRAASSPWQSRRLAGARHGQRARRRRTGCPRGRE
jgi:hypothetical protein